MKNSRLSRVPLLVGSVVALSITRTVIAQGPPPPLQPLAAPVAPAGNPITKTTV